MPNLFDKTSLAVMCIMCHLRWVARSLLPTLQIFSNPIELSKISYNLAHIRWRQNRRRCSSRPHEKDGVLSDRTLENLNNSDDLVENAEQCVQRKMPQPSIYTTHFLELVVLDDRWFAEGTQYFVLKPYMRLSDGPFPASPFAKSGTLFAWFFF